MFNAWRQRTVAVSIVAQIRKKRGGKMRIPILRRALRGLRKWFQKMLAAATRSRVRHIGRLIEDEKEVKSLTLSRHFLMALHL